MGRGVFNDAALSERITYHGMKLSMGTFDELEKYGENWLRLFQSDVQTFERY
jgi:hypothetical protein